MTTSLQAGLRVGAEGLYAPGPTLPHTARFSASILRWRYQEK